MLFFPQNNQARGVFSCIHNDFNLYEKEFVKITPSSVYWGDEYNLINNDDSSKNENKTSFATYRELNPNITFHLPYHKVKITHYSLKSRTNSSRAYNYLSSWRLEGSNDQKEWTLLHSMGETEILKTPNVLKVFQTTKQGVFDTFKLTLTNEPTEQRPDGKFFLVLSSVEVFGSLCDKNATSNLCFIPQISNKLFHISPFLLLRTAILFIIMN